MFRFLLIALCVALASAFMAPVMPSKIGASKVTMHGGKGFGGGEATRDPEPSQYDPNDPKGKQQAIHKAETFADYLARRQREQAAGQ
jgi:rRNA maturation protein Nop10